MNQNTQHKTLDLKFYYSDFDFNKIDMAFARHNFDQIYPDKIKSVAEAIRIWGISRKANPENNVHYTTDLVMNRGQLCDLREQIMVVDNNDPDHHRIKVALCAAIPDKLYGAIGDGCQQLGNNTELLLKMYDLAFNAAKVKDASQPRGLPVSTYFELRSILLKAISAAGDDIQIEQLGRIVTIGMTGTDQQKYLLRLELGHLDLEHNLQLAGQFFDNQDTVNA